jgi:hypothetical protein
MPWTIDGTTIEPVNGASLSPTALAISFEADRGDISQWRAYDRAGDYRRIGEYAGGWRLVDDGGRASTVTLDPPADRKPPLDAVEGYVQSYSEQQVATDRYAVDLTVERETERQDVYSAPAESGGDWAIATAHGTIALEARQVGRASQRGSAEGGQWSLALWLTDTQAGAIADAAGTPGAVVERPVGDGEDGWADASGGRQTVTITAPAGATLPGGDHFVAGWGLEHAGYGPRREWRADLTLV